MSEIVEDGDRKHKIQQLICSYFEDNLIGIVNLEKSLAVFEPITSDDFAACSVGIINQLVVPLIEIKLRKISQLLEKQFGGCLMKYSTRVILENINNTIKLWTEGNVEVTQNQVHLAIRVILQIVQNSWVEDRNSNVDENLIIETEITLLNVIEDNDCSIENVMLAGTCLVRLLFKRFSNLESVVNKFVSLLSDMNKPDQMQFRQLILLHGFLNSGHQLFFMFKIDGIPLLLLIFPSIIRMSENNTSYTFQCFQLLVSWLITVKKHLHQLTCEYQKSVTFKKSTFDENETIKSSQTEFIGELCKWWHETFKNCSRTNEYLFQSSSRVFVTLNNVIAVNWENLIHGVLDLIKDCFILLLDLHMKEAELLGINDDLIDKLVSQHMNTSWTVKGKYAPLSILISHFGFQKLLQRYPKFPFHLTETLYSNPLASAGAEVYRSTLRSARKEENDDIKLITLWKETWLPPLQIALQTNDTLVQQNIYRHWLPSTLAIIPATYHCLVEHFRVSKVTCYQNALMTVMRQARQTGLVNLENMDLNLILEALFHLDENVRIQALALLCCSHKKAEPISDNEIKLISEFLPYNMNIDSAPFRQQLINQMKSILVRIRDSCITLISQQKKNRNNLVSTRLKTSLEFVDNFVRMIVENLSPGANFQRRQTSLELLQLVLDTLIAPPNSSKRKGGVPEKTPIVVEYALKRNLWNFTSDEVFQRLLTCLHDFMSEIKLLAIQILNGYFLNQELLMNEDNVLLMQQKAMSWINSPKVHVCESGALLANFIFNKVKLNKTSEMYILDWLQDLINNLQHQFKTAQSNMFLAAQKYPMHGLILALRTFLSNCEWNNDWLNEARLSGSIEYLQSILINIVDYVLSVLASKSNTSLKAPSFADMGNAIDEILDASGVNNDGDNPALSLEHQLILSCCWLTLKESSFLLSTLVTKLPLKLKNNHGILSVSFAQRSIDVLVKILTRCRHRGAIEACSIAVGDICKTLSSQQLSQYRDIPKTTLKYVLEVIETTNSASSITRRSAGLPLLVVAIVANETNLRNRILLDETMQCLLKTASKLLNEFQCDTLDLPQTHALHMLRALMHDSSLSQVVLPYVVPCIKLCIDNFSSPSWTIRNASLQLYGSIVPRLLGQKKVRDDHSQHNNLTAKVLFYRYPELKGYLLDTLQQMQKNRNPAHLGLVPILSLLSKLTPDVDKGKLDQDINEFSNHLQFFIGSPLYVVRKLTADAFVATCCRTPENVFKKVLQDIFKKSNCINYVHGNLLIIKNILKLENNSNIKTDEVVKNFEDLYSCLESQTDSAYFVRATVINIIVTILGNKQSPFLNDIIEMFLQNNTYDSFMWLPGKIEWMREITLFALSTSCESRFMLLVKKYLNSNNQDQILNCLNFVNTRIESGISRELNLFLQHEIITLLCLSPHPCYVQLSLDLLLILMTVNQSTLRHHTLIEEDSLSFFKKSISGSYGVLAAANTTVVLGFILRTCIQPVMDLKCKELTSIWCKHIYDHSDPTQAEDLRIKAAESLRQDGPLILDWISTLKMKQMNQCVEYLFDAGVKLLTDENSQVRNTAAEFAALLPRSQNFYQFPSVHSIYGLQIFLNYFSSEFGELLLFGDVLWKKLSNQPSTCNLLDQFLNEDRNSVLFEKDDVNIYVEQHELVKMYSTLIQNLLNDNQNSSLIKTWLEIKTASTLLEASETIKYITNSSSASDFLYLSNLVSSKPFVVLYKLISQINILLQVKFLDKSLNRNLKVLILQLQEKCALKCIK